MSTNLDTALTSGNTEELISIINANPTRDTITQLTESFIKLSQTHPANTHTYALTLLSARDSGKISKIGELEPATPQPQQQGSFSPILNRTLYHVVTAILSEDPTPTPTPSTGIQPDNSYIVSSLISGTVIRTGLSFSSAQIGEITRGLHFSGSEYKSYFSPEKYEINAVGACVHLVAAGKEVYKGDLIEEAELKKRLGEIGKYIKDPVGLRILEVARSQVGAGFSDPLTVADIWKTLFP